MVWKPGQSGNPGGRRPACEMVLLARKYGPAMVQYLADVANNVDGETKTCDRIVAAKDLLNRGYGSPKQTTEITGVDGDEIITKIVYSWAVSSPEPITLCLTADAVADAPE